MRLLAEHEQSVGIRDSDPRDGERKASLRPETAWGLNDDIRERDPETITENSILKTQIETDNENASSI